VTQVAKDLLDTRLPAIRATDVILAALQAAFAAEALVDGANPYRFVREDPARSRVWVCDPDSRVEFSERDGSRAVIMVSRGDYVPSEMHLHNRGDGDWRGGDELFDHATTMVFVSCEDGNKTSSETLASLCYGVIKYFRADLMRQYDILNLKLHSVSPPSRNPEAPGAPWVTTVALRLETQERLRRSEIANRLNHLAIEAALSANERRLVASLDATPRPLL
jgi:hypothetical protein